MIYVCWRSSHHILPPTLSGTQPSIHPLHCFGPLPFQTNTETRMKIAAHNRNYNLIPTFPCCWQSDWYYHVISLTNAAAAAGRLAAPTPPLLLVVQGNEVIFCSYIAISLLVCSWLKSGQIVSVQRHLVPFNQLQLAFLSAEGSIIQTRQEKIPHYNTHKHTQEKKCCTCLWIVTIETPGLKLRNFYLST